MVNLIIKDHIISTNKQAKSSHFFDYHDQVVLRTK